jgi:hypothetical protein
VLQVRSCSGTIHDEISKELPLYTGSHSFEIKTMGFMGCINATYWSYYLYNTVVNQGVIVNGIDLGGDARVAFVGLVGTGLIFYSTHLYATRACNKAWISADRKRLGFQLHTAFGGNGRKIEVPIVQARTINWKASEKTQLLPVRIIGLNFNIVLNRTGTYFESSKLLEILADNEQRMVATGATQATPDVDSKEKRIEWRHQVSRRRK